MPSNQLPAPDYHTYFMHVQCRIAPSRIGFLRFLLEGYDEMALLSTINNRTGTILLRYARCFESQLFLILQGLNVDFEG
jgi:hypothetical protein